MKKFLVLLMTIALCFAACIPALAEEAADSSALMTSSIIAVAVLLVLMAVGVWFSAKRVKWNAAMIAKAALCVALAYILNMITLYRMPMGGSITLVAMLPLVLFTVAFGPLEGLLAGCVFGLLDLLINPYVIHPIQMLVDYPMAYGAVALAYAGWKLPVNKKLKLPLAVLFGYFGRYVMAVLSGVVFFAEYAGEQGALVYSLVYNISYLGIEALVCFAVTLIPGMHRLPELMRKGR
ncbi:MAG: energy-coupled thiamine transporter ThiT [Clostridia bacterium]|nr:energy-coupled thiamine transporter ThiT [Clostridia bacterium]